MIIQRQETPYPFSIFYPPSFLCVIFAFQVSTNHSFPIQLSNTHTHILFSYQTSQPANAYNLTISIWWNRNLECSLWCGVVFSQSYSKFNFGVLLQFSSILFVCIRRTQRNERTHSHSLSHIHSPLTQLIFSFV